MPTTTLAALAVPQALAAVSTAPLLAGKGQEGRALLKRARQAAEQHLGVQRAWRWQRTCQRRRGRGRSQFPKGLRGSARGNGKVNGKVKLANVTQGAPLAKAFSRLCSHASVTHLSEFLILYLCSSRRQGCHGAAR